MSHKPSMCQLGTLLTTIIKSFGDSCLYNCYSRRGLSSRFLKPMIKSFLTSVRVSHPKLSTGTKKKPASGLSYRPHQPKVKNNHNNKTRNHTHAVARLIDYYSSLDYIGLFRLRRTGRSRRGSNTIAQATSSRSTAQHPLARRDTNKTGNCGNGRHSPVYPLCTINTVCYRNQHTSQ